MGLGNWVKNKSGKLKDEAKGTVNYGQIKSVGTDVVDMASSLLSPNKLIKGSKKETFDEARQRLGVSDLDLINTYRNYAISFFMSLFFVVLCFVLIVYFLYFEKSIMGGLSTTSIMLLNLANTFRFSFRAFQIKNQKLCSVSDWWSRSDQWVPKIERGG